MVHGRADELWLGPRLHQLMIKFFHVASTMEAMKTGETETKPMSKV
jgi:hypothetical protein